MFDLGVVAPGHTSDRLMQSQTLRHFEGAVDIRIPAEHRHIVQDGALKKSGLLGQIDNLGPQADGIELPDILAVDQDAAFRRQQEPHHQAKQGRFAGPVGS